MSSRLVFVTYLSGLLDTVKFTDYVATPNESFVRVHPVGHAPDVRQQCVLCATFFLYAILNKLMLCDPDRRTSA
jgi:hypothetical protein